MKPKIPDILNSGAKTSSFSTQFEKADFDAPSNLEQPHLSEDSLNEVVAAIANGMLSPPLDEEEFVFGTDLTPEEVEAKFYRMLAQAQKDK